MSDSGTCVWHTGQLTVSAEEEDVEEEEGVKVSIPGSEEVEEDAEEVAVAVLCCIAGAFVFPNSLGAAESLPNAFWKKS